MNEFDNFCNHCQCLSKDELNEALIDAISDNDFDKIKFLLSSSDLKEHADIHTQKDDFFRILCIWRDLSVLSYLVFDLNIKQTDEINEHLNWYKQLYKESKSFDCLEFIEKAEYFFQQRELKHQITSELKQNLIPSKKHKL
jgi:hypothetical protein